MAVDELTRQFQHEANQARRERDKALGMVDDLEWALGIALGGKMPADPRVGKVQDAARAYLAELKES